MKLKQFLPICLMSCASIQSNAIKIFADGATTTTPVNATQKGEVETNLKLSISPDRKRNWPGDPITINIILRNAGKADVPLESTQPLFDYQVELVYPDGTKATITPEGKQMMERLAFSQSRVSGVLHTGEEGNNTYTDLTKIFDMKQNGVYQVTFSRLVPKRADPNKAAKSRVVYYRGGTDAFGSLKSAAEVAEIEKKEMAEMQALQRQRDKEFVKITSNTIRFGIGDIPEGALDEKPVEKVASDEVDITKVTPKAALPKKPKAVVPKKPKAKR